MSRVGRSKTATCPKRPSRSLNCPFSGTSYGARTCRFPERPRRKSRRAYRRGTRFRIVTPEELKKLSRSPKQNPSRKKSKKPPLRTLPQKNPKKSRKSLLQKQRQKQTPPPTSRRNNSGRHALCLISSCLQRKLKKRTTQKTASRSSEAARRSVTQATFPKTANARASAAP